MRHRTLSDLVSSFEGVLFKDAIIGVPRDRSKAIKIHV
jgi:hypothetical protein